MHAEQREEAELNAIEETPDAWWYRVYAAVIVTTVLVITALWAFSRFFSK